MRYVAKIHVLDILDTVVVSGYVHEYPDLQGEPVEQHDFSESVPSRGVDDWKAWLAVALYQTLMTDPHLSGGRH